MSDTILKHLIFEQSNLKYSFFNQSKFSNVKFDQVDFTDSSMTETTLKKFETVDSKFVNNNLFKTLLADVDFSKNELMSPIVSSPPIELKGATINLFQAADLIKLWGIHVN